MRTSGGARTPLNTARVLEAAVAFADASGIDALSMRVLADRLGVVPMALYRHVANKDQLIDGMIDLVISEVDPPRTDCDWRTAVRTRILSARQALLRHRWASRVMESRSFPTETVLAYMNSTIGMFLAGGFSVDLTHHCMHALGSRMYGFTQELYVASQTPSPQAAQMQAIAMRFPHLVSIAQSAMHEHDSTVAPGCDDQFEFEFALDLILDGFELLRQRNWHSANRQTGLAAA